MKSSVPAQRLVFVLATSLIATGCMGTYGKSSERQNAKFTSDAQNEGDEVGKANQSGNLPPNVEAPSTLPSTDGFDDSEESACSSRDLSNGRVQFFNSIRRVEMDVFYGGIRYTRAVDFPCGTKLPISSDDAYILEKLEDAEGAIVSPACPQVNGSLLRLVARERLESLRIYSSGGSYRIENSNGLPEATVYDPARVSDQFDETGFRYQSLLSEFKVTNPSDYSDNDGLRYSWRIDLNEEFRCTQEYFKPERGMTRPDQSGVWRSNTFYLQAAAP